MKIVLLDDNEMDLFVSRKLLENIRPEFTVESFTNPDLAFAHLADGAGINAIFVDNQMPGITGFDFLKRLIENDVHIPFMAVLTASLGSAERKKYAELGSSVHLFEKPIKPDQIKLSMAL